MSDMVRFVLTGSDKGQTKALKKDHAGKPLFPFVDGVMEMHPSRVTGRLIIFLRDTYSVRLESEVEANGERDIPEDGNDSERSEDVQDGGLTEESVSPAAKSAIKLSGDDKPKAGKKKRSAKRN